jgi:hypothetical protein
MACLAEMMVTYMVVMGKPEGNRTLGNLVIVGKIILKRKLQVM